MALEQTPARTTEQSSDLASGTPTADTPSRKSFLGTAAKTLAGAAAVSGVGSVMARTTEAASRVPQVMRKGSQVTLNYYFYTDTPGLHVRQKLYDQFMAENPDIKIVNQLDSAIHLEKFNTELAGGNAPDLTMSWELDYPAYAKRGVYLDLNEFIKKDSEFQHSVMSQQYPAVLDMFSYGGKLWVLPEQVTDTVLFYNKDHVAAAGLKMPTSWNDKSWTWDKFLSYAKKLTQTRGSRITRYGVAEMWGWELTAVNVLGAANGGDWFKQPINPPPGSSNLSDPKIERAVQWYADLTNVYKVAASNSALTTTPGVQLFQSGRASMGITGHWNYSALSQTPGLNFDIAPIPIGPNGSPYSRTNIGGTGISICASTKYPEQCWRFVKFWAGLTGQKAIAQSGLFVPALKSVGASPAYTKSNNAMAHALLFTDVLAQGHVHSLPISVAWPEFQIPWRSQLESQVWQGTEPASKVLPQLDRTINADLKKYS